MRPRPRWRREAALAVGAAIFACAVALFVLRPIQAGAVDYDSTASVLYFDRIVSGTHLETPLAATPKPLLTVVLGGLYAAFHDWRPLVWATILAYAVAIGGAAVLARRYAGLAAGVFAVVALVCSGPLLIDVSRAYGVSWAMLGWVVAGLALSGPRVRYGIAGLALLLASLARIETLVVVAVAAAAIVVAAIVARRRHVPGPPAASLLLLVGFAAIPLMLVHDWLLIGDPFYWAEVAARFSAAVPDVIAQQTPRYMVGWLSRFFAGFGFLSALAVLGFAFLLHRRAWVPALGILALGPGVGAFLVLLTVRGTFVSTRYAIPIELAIMFAAAIGFGSIRVPWLAGVVSSWTGRFEARRRLLVAVTGTIVVAAISALAMSKTVGPVDRGVLSTIRTELALSLNSDRVVPVIRQHLTTPGGTGPRLLVPRLMPPRFAVALGLPYSRIGGDAAAGVTGGTFAANPGLIVYHDGHADTDGQLQMLESSGPVQVNGATLRQLAADPARQYWVWQVVEPTAARVP